MDKFSELVNKGVAAFNYRPIAGDTPNACPVCTEYNNIFSIATDTHMSCLEDGTHIITGSLVSKRNMFDRFIWSGMFGGVNFIHAGYYSFADWASKHMLAGHYDIMNGDAVYVMNKIEAVNPNGKMDPSVKTISSFTTENNNIPTSVRFLAHNGEYRHIVECFKDTLQETANAMNESKDVLGNSWVVANLSDGDHIVGVINGINYKI